MARATLLKRIILFTEVTLLVLVCFGVSAEGGTCPDGYYPIGGQGLQGCAPFPGGSGGDNAPRDPGPQWATRWGAIAVDGTSSRLGGSEKHTSKRRAQKAALADCKKNGGTKCKGVIAYYNQCGVLAWGNDWYQAHSGATTDAATAGALASCSKNTSNCKVFYTGCSYPERIR